MNLAPGSIEPPDQSPLATMGMWSMWTAYAVGVHTGSDESHCHVVFFLLALLDSRCSFAHSDHSHTDDNKQEFWGSFFHVAANTMF